MKLRLLPLLAALLVVRGLPAVVYRRVLDPSHTAIAGLMQATSLPFIVAATAIGLDLGLIETLALVRPQWQIAMVGPHAKLDPASLPRRPNIHYFGQQAYEDLPRFVAGWDVCLQPFALNEATRFISPTKTPEYLAAGCRVVSTAVKDVMSPYGEQKLVEIAGTPDEFRRSLRRHAHG